MKPESYVSTLSRRAREATKRAENLEQRLKQLEATLTASLNWSNQIWGILAKHPEALEAVRKARRHPDFTPIGCGSGGHASEALR